MLDIGTLDEPERHEDPMRMSNRRNRFVYRFWAPFYDALLGRFFRQGRKQAMNLVGLRPGERVCFVGVGTGADLCYLPRGVDAVGVDPSEAMLAKAEEKLPIDGCEMALRVCDAQALGMYRVILLRVPSS